MRRGWTQNGLCLKGGISAFLCMKSTPDHSFLLTGDLWFSLLSFLFLTQRDVFPLIRYFMCVFPWENSLLLMKTTFSIFSLLTCLTSLRCGGREKTSMKICCHLKSVSFKNWENLFLFLSLLIFQKRIFQWRFSWNEFMKLSVIHDALTWNDLRKNAVE